MSKIIGWLTGGWIGPVIGLVALLGSLWAGHAYIVHNARSEGRAEVQALWDQDMQARALMAAAAAEEKRIKEKQHELDIASERKQREIDRVVAGRALADTRAALERLRHTTATIASGAVPAGEDSAARFGTDDPSQRLGAVFGECAGELVGVADQTEQLATQVRGLQAYANSALSVCGQ